MDCILLSGRERRRVGVCVGGRGGGCWIEGRRERMSERGSGVVHRSSEGHGSSAPAKKTVLNTCSCLQRPFNLLITCQSITRQPDQMSAAAREGGGGGREGRGAGKERREKARDRLHVWESRK